MYVEREREGDIAAHFLLCCTEPPISLETKQLCIKADASWRVPPPAAFFWTVLSDTTRDQDYGMHFDWKSLARKNVSKPKKERSGPGPINIIPPRPEARKNSTRPRVPPSFTQTQRVSPRLSLDHGLAAAKTGQKVCHNFSDVDADSWSLDKSLMIIKKKIHKYDFRHPSTRNRGSPWLIWRNYSTSQVQRKKGAETDSQISFCSQIFRLEPNQELPTFSTTIAVTSTIASTIASTVASTVASAIASTILMQSWCAKLM